jgi:hypothetical protein
MAQLGSKPVLMCWISLKMLANAVSCQLPVAGIESFRASFLDFMLTNGRSNSRYSLSYVDVCYCEASIVLSIPHYPTDILEDVKMSQLVASSQPRVISILNKDGVLRSAKKAILLGAFKNASRKYTVKGVE